MTITKADRDLAGLAVLGLLLTGPKHPYQLHRTMIDWGQNFVPGLPRSIYHAITRLEQASYIEPLVKQQTGSRPKRTVYAITETGSDHVRTWVERLLATPDPDRAILTATLSFIVALPPQRAAAALRARTEALTEQITTQATKLAKAPDHLPRVFLIGVECARASADAELSWVRRLVRDLDDGSLTWPTDLIQFATDLTRGDESRP